MILQEPDRQNMINEAIDRLGYAVNQGKEQPDYLFYLGRAFALNNEHESAVELLKKAVSLDRSQKDYLFRLGKEQNICGKTEDAKENLEETTRLDQQYVPARNLLSQIYSIENNWEKVEEHAKLGLSSEWNTESFDHLVHGLYYQQKYGAVAELVQKYPEIQVTEDRVDCLFLIGRSYSILGHPGTAINFLNSAVQFPNALPKHFYYLGCTHARLGQYTEAHDAFSHVQDSEKALYARKLLQMGYIKEICGQQHDAEALFESAFDANPADPDILCAMAKSKTKAGDLVGASSYLDQAVTNNPDHLNSHVNRAIVYERREMFDSACEEYQWVNSKEDNIFVLRRLAILTIKTNPQQSIGYLEKVRNLGADSDEIRNLLGLALAKVGRYTDAIETWESVQSEVNEDLLRKNLMMAYYSHGVECFQENMVDEGIAQWETYLQENWDDLQNRRILGLMYIKNALTKYRKDSMDLVDLIPIARRAHNLDPESAIIRYYLSLFELRHGETEGATRTLRTLFQEDQYNQRYIYHLGLALHSSQDPGALSFLRIVDTDPYLKLSHIYMARQMLAYDEITGAELTLVPIINEILEEENQISWDLHPYDVTLILLLAAIESRLGKNQDASKLLQRALDKSENATLHYYHGLLHVIDNNYSAAITELRNTVNEGSNDSHKDSRILLMKLLLQEVATRLCDENHEGATETLSELIALNPDEEEILEGIKGFKQLLPLSYIRTGKREKAAQIWEEEQHASPPHPLITHALSVLYLWWAVHSERANIEMEAESEEELPDLDSLWKKTIGNVILLQHIEEFWQEWIKQRIGAWSRPDESIPIEDVNLSDLREAGKRRIYSLIKEFSKEYYSANRESDVKRMDHYTALLELEEKSAAAFKKISRDHDDIPHDLQHAYGALAAGQLGLEEKISGLLQSIQLYSVDGELMEECRTLFSPLGLTLIYSKKKQYEKAIDSFDSLPYEIRESEAGKTLFARIYHRRGNDFYDIENDIESAIDAWKKAFSKSSEQMQYNISTDAVKRILGVSKQMNEEKKYEEAIDLLKRGLLVTTGPECAKIYDYLAFVHCNYAQTFLESKQHSKLIGECTTALGYKADYRKAKDLISIAYNNIGIECSQRDDFSGAITNYKKSMEYADDSTVRKNLAAAYYNEAAVESHSYYPNQGMIMNNLLQACKLDPSNPKYRQDLMNYMRR